MNKKKKSQLFIMIVYVATIIVTLVGATFAYFSASVKSKENAVGMTAAVFKVELEDDKDLIKTKLIPSENKNFIKPYEDENKELVKAKTACIDDHLNEICSIYTFTIINPMTTTELPAHVTLIPSINSFSNLYFKIVDENKNVVMPATHIKDDRPYTFDEKGKKVFAANSQISPIVLSGINVTLPKATKDEKTGKVIPSKATFSIILWIMETGNNQTRVDGSQVFAGGIKVESSGANGGGITGTLTAGGEE